jgi:hypothetical protein
MLLPDPTRTSKATVVAAAGSNRQVDAPPPPEKKKPAPAEKEKAQPPSSTKAIVVAGDPKQLPRPRPTAAKGVHPKHQRLHTKQAEAISKKHSRNILHSLELVSFKICILLIYFTAIQVCTPISFNLWISFC